MKAIVTGAAKGIGREMVCYLHELGFEIIAIDIDQKGLTKLKNKLGVKTKKLDLLKEENVYLLSELADRENVDLFINNAGFGFFGLFAEIDLQTELKMIELNIRTYHILTKLILQQMEQKNGGYILNVGSCAGFLCAPRMATYYATKNYINKLTIAIQEELNKQNSNVHLGLLCPGKVNTNFFDQADGDILTSGYDPSFIAQTAIDQLFKQKKIIIPGFKMKILIFMSRFLSWKALAKIMYSLHKPED